MKIDIFIKSYYRDFDYLKYAIKSVSKFVSGYNNIHLVIPENDLNFLDRTNLPNNTIIHGEKESGDGYLYQQYVKITAWKYSDADIIVFIDSDTIWKNKVYLPEFIDSKPTILMTSYVDKDGNSKVGDALCWRLPTIEYFDSKIPINFEYMRRHPFIYFRETLVNVSNIKGNYLKDYILSRKNRNFSEFNIIGAYAHYFEPDKYNFVDTDDWEYEDALVFQGWSWGGIANDIDTIMKILDE